MAMVSKPGIRSALPLEEDLCDQDTGCSDTEDVRSVGSARSWQTDQDAADGARDMIHSEAWGMAHAGIVNNVSMGYQGYPCDVVPVPMGYISMCCFVAVPMPHSGLGIIDNGFASENSCSVGASLSQERSRNFDAAEKWKHDRAMLSEQHLVSPPKQWQSPCAPGASQADPRVEPLKPSSTGRAAEYQESGSGNTTVILRGLPAGCTRDVLLQRLDKQGFVGKYDFVHLPIDFQTEDSLRYAIVNFVSNSVAIRMFEHEDFQMPGSDPCGPNDQAVAWNTPHQGLESHIDRYRNSPLMHSSVHDKYRPVLFKNGVRIAFPQPTARIKAPRIRHQKNCTKGMPA